MMDNHSNSLNISLNFHLEDLLLVERDLSPHEKVSLLFLLHGLRDTRYILERLTLENQNPYKEDTNYLIQWAQKYPDKWKETLLEALTIIQSNKILEKLGQNTDLVNGHFLPQIPTVCLFIPVILKSLYYLCENISEDIARKLINRLSRQFGDLLYLEIYILHLLSASMNTVFDNQSNSNDLNLQMLSTFFKEHECYDFHDLLKSIQEQIINRGLSFQNRSKVNSGIIGYSLSRNTIGHVLIINQRDFYMEKNKELAHLLPKTVLKKRQGTDIDRERISQTFARFGYKILIEHNLTHSKIIKNIKNLVEISDNSDSIVLVILSHGQKGTIFGSNSIPLKVNDIKDIIASKNLLGVPKLIFIQACQGDALHCAEKFNQLETDGDSINKINANEPRLCDMLVSWSTIPGFASIRHIEKGSWFIQEICNKIELLHKSEHLQDILTAVIHDVSNKRGYSEECMIPIMHSTLRKKFYFPT